MAKRSRWDSVTLEHRLLAKVEKHDDDCECCDGCWHWTGGANRNGYGVIYRDGVRVQVHRASYEEYVGRPMPEGTEIDHLCKRPSCVNPEHLEAVTRAENVRRGSKAQQTHCGRGHEFTAENTRRSKRGERMCRTCHAAREWARVHGTTIEVALATPRRGPNQRPTVEIEV